MDKMSGNDRWFASGIRMKSKLTQRQLVIALDRNRMCI